MYLLNSLNDLPVNTNSTPKTIIDIIKNDLCFLLEELNYNTSKTIHDFILIENEDNIESLIYNDLDILVNTIPQNILQIDNDFFKASIILNDYFCVSVYFNKNHHPKLLNWIHKNTYYFYE